MDHTRTIKKNYFIMNIFNITLSLCHLLILHQWSKLTHQQLTNKIDG